MAKVIARMTVTRSSGQINLIEVREDATFSTFYQVYSQIGKRRSTKRLIRHGDRNEGLHPHYQAYLMQPGLEKLAEHWSKLPGVQSVKVRIIRKRLYRKLISARPDELGLVTTKVNIPIERFSPLRIPVQLNQIKLSVGSVPQTDRNGL